MFILYNILPERCQQPFQSTIYSQIVGNLPLNDYKHLITIYIFSLFCVGNFCQQHCRNVLFNCFLLFYYWSLLFTVWQTCVTVDVIFKCILFICGSNEKKSSVCIVGSRDLLRYLYFRVSICISKGKCSEILLLCDTEIMNFYFCI